jgi:hypothetical protein
MNDIAMLSAPHHLGDLMDWSESALRAGFTRHAIGLMVDLYLLRGLS